MTAMTLGMKVRRTLTFLTGLAHPRVAARLAHHGFGEAQLAEGWELLTRVTGARLGRLPATSAAQTDLDALDEWENKWFPITEATLARHFPAIRDRVSLNLRQSTGREVLVSVGTFLDHLAALAESEDADDAVALELLEQRGRNAQTRMEADLLLADITSVAETVEDQANQVEQELEDAMWTYYLEWSAIARTVIDDGRLLQRLGFRRKRPTPPAEPETNEAPTDGDPPPAEVDNPDDTLDGPIP